jgi:hypothetical protein
VLARRGVSIRCEYALRTRDHVAVLESTTIAVLPVRFYDAIRGWSRATRRIQRDIDIFI